MMPVDNARTRWLRLHEIEAIKASADRVDPIVLQIVEGTLNSIEAEIEYAIERTARSPMIRSVKD